MRIDHSAHYASVAKQLLNMYEIFGLGILHCGFVVSERVERYLSDPLVAEPVCDFDSMAPERSGEMP